MANPDWPSNAVFPHTQIQTCIVHLIRTSLNYVGWKDRKALAAELKCIYQAVNAEAAEAALTEFEQGAWGKKFPPITAAWRRKRTQVVPFFAYPPDVRKIIYTTNAIESLHMQLRKIVKNRDASPATKPPPSCCTWPCAISSKTGRCRHEHGKRRPINWPSCSANDSRTH